MMRTIRSIDPRRIAGAAGFAAAWTVVFAVGQLLDRDIDIAGLVGMFLGGWLVAYVAWPGLSEIWSQRDRREDPKRFLTIGIGVAVGFALDNVVNFLAGDDAATWSLALWTASVAAIFGLVLWQIWRTRRS